MQRSSVVIRKEEPPDYRRTEELTRDAFWDFEPNGADEHYLTHILRNHPDFIPELCHVAEKDGKVVGSIVYSKSTITKQDGRTIKTVTFGPIAVDPKYQREGIGRALIQHTVRKAKVMGFPAVVIYGDPAYYSQSGFRLGEKFDIRNHLNQYSVPLQVLVLQEGIDLSGCFRESKAFDELDLASVANFDASFPPKVKGIIDQQTYQRIQMLKSLTYPVVEFGF
eukprot:TRINITY_DN29969_c0_g1_i2.p1 TRINITY_DN29969_c0_g1~~TRINITY_DN29969_c0_g1_i2.p1  ORF type:complete len:223 (-),score=29.23 TRINITY_DN29969_c0_g1_i2:302-970(-)